MNALTNDRALLGISLVVIGLSLFALQDMTMKYFSTRYSAIQIVFVRSLVAMVPITLMVLLSSGRQGLRSNKPGLSLLRGLLGFLSYIGYYLAIAALPLAEVVAIVFLAPIIVTMLSALLLREQVGWRRWLAVLMGFIGALVVVGPSGQLGNAAVGLACFAAVSYAGAIILTRYIAPYDQPWTITWYTTAVFAVGSIFAATLIFVMGWQPGSDNPSLQFMLRSWNWSLSIDLSLMIGIGLTFTVGMYCLTKAYCTAPASIVAPFEYTYILWAVLFGYLFWQEVPKPTTLLGISLLISSSLYIFYREYQLSQGQQAKKRWPSIRVRPPRLQRRLS